MRPEALAQRVARHFTTLKSNAGERFVLHPECDGRIVNVATADTATPPTDGTAAGAGAGAGAGSAKA